MSYQIRKSDGTLLLELGDGFTDSSSSSLTFVGRNVSKFGELQNNNFLHLLEHFAALTEPSNKLSGQLWFDTSANILKLYNQDKWQSLATLAYSTDSSNASSTGNLWYDSANQQLHINTGTGFTLIGPEKVLGFGVTKFVSTSLLDLSSGVHPVIECVLDNEVIAIISRDSFSVNSSNGLTGFPQVGRGITFKNSTAGDLQLFGLSESATSASTLKNESNQSVSASSLAIAGSIVQRNSLGNSAFNALTVSSITTGSGTISGTWSVTDGFNPDTNGGANLGTSGLRWSSMYAQTADATTVNATTVKFSVLTDPTLASITKFDADTALTANSDSRLATQKAIKTYIDAAVAAEVASRLAAESAINSQLNGLETIPKGTIMFTAGSAVPSGFLSVNGQTLAIAVYPALFAALGGVSMPYSHTDTTFNLPDLRGEFIRGWDNSRGVDAGRELGSTQQSDVEPHVHNFTDAYANVGDYGLGPSNMSNYDRNGNYVYPSFYAGNASDGDHDNGMYGFPSKTDSSSGSETRPRNIALHAIIKF